MLTIHQSLTIPNITTLTAAARIACDTWKTIARQAAADRTDRAMAAREVAARQVACGLLQRVLLITTWEEVRRPLQQKRHWDN